MHIDPSQRVVNMRYLHRPLRPRQDDYCKWCYTDGKYVYQTKDALLDFLLGHMPNPDGLDAEERRGQYDVWLSQLKHWKNNTSDHQ